VSFLAAGLVGFLCAPGDSVRYWTKLVFDDNRVGAEGDRDAIAMAGGWPSRGQFLGIRPLADSRSRYYQYMMTRGLVLGGSERARIAAVLVRELTALRDDIAADPAEVDAVLRARADGLRVAGSHSGLDVDLEYCQGSQAMP
jgi:hypothetical protein